MLSRKAVEAAGIDQRRLVLCALAPLCPGNHLSINRRPRSLPRKGDQEIRPLATAVQENIDRAAVGLQQMPGDGQPHAPAVLLPGKQRLEDPPPDATRDARSVVGKQHLALIAEILHLDPDPRAGHALQPVDGIGRHDLMARRRSLPLE